MNANKNHNGSSLPWNFVQFIPLLTIEAPFYVTQEVGVAVFQRCYSEITLSIFISEHLNMHF